VARAPCAFGAWLGLGWWIGPLRGVEQDPYTVLGHGGPFRYGFPCEWNAACLEGRNLGEDTPVSLSHGLCGSKAGPSPQRPPSLLMRPMPQCRWWGPSRAFAWLYLGHSLGLVLQVLLVPSGAAVVWGRPLPHVTESNIVTQGHLTLLSSVHQAHVSSCHEVAPVPRLGPCGLCRRTWSPQPLWAGPATGTPGS